MMRLLGLAAALSLVAMPATAQVIGISSAVRNDVRIRPAGAPVARPAQVKQRVALNDAVQTGVKSQLQILLLDKSVFTVGANARLVIDRYVYDPARGTRSVGATVAKGAFRFMSGKPDRSGGSAIRTPIASIGIRGTILEGVVGESAALIAASEPGTRGVESDPATATLVILRGPGRGAGPNVVPGELLVSAGGRSVTVNAPLQAVFVPRPGAAPIGPFRISPNALKQVQALLYPAVAQRLGWRGPADNLGGDPGSVYYPPEPERPAYPPQGGPYPGGRYPPGAYPGRPGTSAPPVSGAGFGVPRVPAPNARVPQTNNGPTGQQTNSVAPTAAPTPSAGPTPAPSPTPSPQSQNNPNGGNSLNSAPPPSQDNPPPGQNGPPPANANNPNTPGGKKSPPPDTPR